MNLITMHHQTKFGNKAFDASEDIIRTNIHILCFDLDHSNLIIFHKIP